MLQCLYKCSHPGRKEIIAEFKALVSSFPQEMTTMQSQLRIYKEAAADAHSLRADVQSLSSILDRKVGPCNICWCAPCFKLRSEDISSPCR